MNVIKLYVIPNATKHSGCIRMDASGTLRFAANDG